MERCTTQIRIALASRAVVSCASCHAGVVLIAWRSTWESLFSYICHGYVQAQSAAFQQCNGTLIATTTITYSDYPQKKNLAKKIHSDPEMIHITGHDLYVLDARASVVLHSKLKYAHGIYKQQTYDYLQGNGLRPTEPRVSLPPWTVDIFPVSAKTVLTADPVPACASPFSKKKNKRSCSSI